MSNEVTPTAAAATPSSVAAANPEPSPTSTTDAAAGEQESAGASSSELVPEDEPPTEEQMRANVLRLAFGGDPRRFEEFCRVLRQSLPGDTAVVLRGSALTGRRWADGSPFDSKGPGTSDLDLTLVGAEAVKLFKLSGFFVPGVHSRPMGEKDPDIAPELAPLRETLVEMVGRPVNIQASLDVVMQFRGDLLGQPYLVILDRSPEPAEGDPA
jgi:hypothetical protein